MNTLYRTSLVAGSTARALIVVDNGEVVLKSYCTLRACLHTLTAGDTAVLTNAANVSARLLARTLNDNVYGIAYNVDYSIGAGLGAKATAYALSRVYLRNSLLGVNADSVTGTNLHTVSVAEAGEFARHITKIGHIRHLTALGTVEYELFKFGSAGTVAGNVGNLLYDLARLKTHNISDLARSTVTAGNAERGIISLALGESLGVSLTARISTSAAVSTGKTVKHGGDTLVLFNSEENRRDGEYDGAQKSYYRKNCNRNKYWHKNVTFPFVESVPYGAPSF